MAGITQNEQKRLIVGYNPHPLKRLFDHEVTQGRHIIKVNCNFHGHIYTST